MLTHPMQPDAYWHLTIRIALPWFAGSSDLSVGERFGVA